MSRWRPPAEKSSTYITPQGASKLENELKQLWDRRKDVTKHLSAAAAEGDRSENAEYIYRKKELREIDRRLRYLQKRLQGITIVSELPGDQSRVFFGAWVKLEDENGAESEYRIVGADEINTSSGWISVDSPLAKSLLKKGVDDEVQVVTPSGVANFYILGIRYALQG